MQKGVRAQNTRKSSKKAKRLCGSIDPTLGRFLEPYGFLVGSENHSGDIQRTPPPKVWTRPPSQKERLGPVGFQARKEESKPQFKSQPSLGIQGVDRVVYREKKEAKNQGEKQHKVVQFLWSGNPTKNLHFAEVPREKKVVKSIPLNNRGK